VGAAVSRLKVSMLLLAAGSTLGAVVGATVGVDVGATVGAVVCAAVGDTVGTAVGTMGWSVGDAVGIFVSPKFVGTVVGAAAANPCTFTSAEFRRRFDLL
jgi:hypothetical protein